MYLIQNVTTDALQNQTLTLVDGTQFSFTLYFVPMQYGWVITELTYPSKTFTLNGLRITNNPNMLRQWKNILPFGIACFSKSEREPSFQEDFSTGASNLYVLTASEVEQYETILAHG